MTVAMTLLLSCGPTSPEAVMRACAERARAAAAPTGAVAVGIGSGGISSSLSLSVSGDYLRRRDPHDVYEACVRDRTGAGPTRPLVL
ncbi:hypothetical protein [Palleronia abyssalis]|uniref:Uncharacterized protein n=1 Tax=Palleronia abyssalis TaxID=1501240 RepID=A0A2R8C1H2_9RHOB|nr:hypothetical protein [Palleronia abyssalis]SPJ26267.1 hypothetical protein PAA8504_04124 [Palleronia abyssalis]